MIASPPFVRAVGQPEPAGLWHVGRAPLLADISIPPAPGAPISAARDLPGSDLAPKLACVARLQPTVPPARMRLRWAALASVALHMSLVGGYAVLASPVRPLNVADLETAQVELVSQERFMAMSAPQPEIAPSMIAPPAMPAEVAPLEPVLPKPPQDLAQDPPPPTADPMTSLMASLDASPPDSLPDSPPDLALDPPLPQNATGDLPPKPAKPAAQKPKAQKPAAPKTATPKPDTPKTATAKPAPAQAASAAAPMSSGKAEALKVDWGSKVRARINRKIARGEGVGTVKLRLTLAPSGALLAVKVVGSAGPALDGAAVKAVKAAAPFPRAPKGLDAASYTFSLPVKFAG